MEYDEIICNPEGLESGKKIWYEAI
jgi:hypothetical protein